VDAASAATARKGDITSINPFFIGVIGFPAVVGTDRLGFPIKAQPAFATLINKKIILK